MLQFIQAKHVIITGGVTALKKNQRRWYKIALISGVRFWFRTWIHGHFRNTATTKYKYQPRKDKYLKSKAKRGNKPPLVKTGATRRAVTTFIRTSGTARSATGVMNAPWYIRDIKMKGGPAMALEITKINSAEFDKINDHVGREFAKLINDSKDTKTVRI